MANLAKMALDPMSKIRGKVEKRVHKSLGIEHIPTPSQINASIMGDKNAKKMGIYEGPKTAPAAAKRKKVEPQSPDFQIAGRSGSSK